MSNANSRYKQSYAHTRVRVETKRTQALKCEQESTKSDYEQTQACTPYIRTHKWRENAHIRTRCMNLTHFPCERLIRIRCRNFIAFHFAAAALVAGVSFCATCTNAHIIHSIFIRCLHIHSLNILHAKERFVARLACERKENAANYILDCVILCSQCKHSDEEHLHTSAERAAQKLSFAQLFLCLQQFTLAWLSTIKIWPLCYWWKAPLFSHAWIHWLTILWLDWNHCDARWVSFCFTNPQHTNRHTSNPQSYMLIVCIVNP